MYTDEKLREYLDEITDPELGIGIVELGLIRTIAILFDGEVPEETKIVMTLTTPLCPYADVIIEQVETVITVNGFGVPNVEVSFDPPWEATPQLRDILGI